MLDLECDKLIVKMFDHFQNAVRWLSAVISQRGVYLMLFWLSHAIVAWVTSYTCYYIGIPLDASNVFTFLATIQIIQEPIRLVADTAAVFIEARVALTRILKFLEAPELQKERKNHVNVGHQSLISTLTLVS
ncbi:putative ABC-type xenobiotic transporter [Helianthus annuus]|nr:putative ABC-type xenobiotic transporter [Helianthus annuus]KAJ0654855.1 putative ABC-type xenobiotic transporter [Helianthus annuus]